MSLLCSMRYLRCASSANRMRVRRCSPSNGNHAPVAPVELVWLPAEAAGGTAPWWCVQCPHRQQRLWLLVFYHVCCHLSASWELSMQGPASCGSLQCRPDSCSASAQPPLPCRALKQAMRERDRTMCSRCVCCLILNAIVARCLMGVKIRATRMAARISVPAMILNGLWGQRSLSLTPYFVTPTWEICAAGSCWLSHRATERLMHAQTDSGQGRCQVQQNMHGFAILG